MQVDGSVTSVTWIPTDVFKKMLKLGMDLKLGHYDEAPPLKVNGLPALEELRDADRLRMGNHLAAHVEFVDGAPVKAEYVGGSVVGSTRTGIGGAGVTFAGVPMPMLQREPEFGADSVRFVQTVGGRTGVPLPRKVARPPYVQWNAPIAWTTLALTVYADGRSEGELVGASVFPRHWIYDSAGAVVAKSGLIDTQNWLENSYGDATPWGAQDSPAIVSAVESELEHQLSHMLMSGGKKPRIREYPEGSVVAAQGEPGDSLLILLDGILAIDVGGEVLSEVGPGAVMGERAILESGVRTATLTARTPVRVAVAEVGAIDLTELEKLAEGHRREQK